MRLRSMLAATAVLCAMALPGLAAAELAYAASGTTNVRTGPGTNFPVIARVLGGSRVDVQHCLNDRRWCEVSVEGMRGWIAASRLEFALAGQREVVIEEAPGQDGWVPGFTGGGHGGGPVRCLAPYPIC